MKKLLLLCSFFMICLCGSLFAQVINVDFTPKTICPGGRISVILTKPSGYFTSGNSFQVQLSDASGAFGSPVALGAINDTLPDTLFTAIPKTTLPGANFRIRVVSTAPAGTFVAVPTLQVYPRPTAAFTFPNDSQCHKWNRYTFTSTSTAPGGTIANYIWNWNDGSRLDTVLTTTISHTFGPFNPDNYPQLIVTTTDGCRDTLIRKVNIKETPVALTEFNDTIQCFIGNRFIIQSRTNAVYGTITYTSFDVGDGSALRVNIDSFSHKYTNPGIYNVRQINHHSNGCKDTGILSGLINIHPTAVINTNDTDQCIVNNAFIFQAQSFISNGLPLLNSWNIGDGITRDLQDSVHHTYSPFGNRTVRLVTISDDGVDGCADTAYQRILVNPMPKAVISNLDVEKCVNYNRFRFVGKSTVATGTIRHDWNFGDLGLALNQDSVTHSYATQGSYTVRLRATTNKGCTDSTTTSVTVRPSPSASFTTNLDTQCLKFHVLRARSTSTISSGTLARTWILSDGTNYTNVDSIRHKFGTDGKFAIELIVKSTFNCADTAYDSVVIKPMPQSSFTIAKADQCFENNVFSFTNISTFAKGTITGYKWLYGDGSTASNISPASHSYAAEGDYIPALVVQGNNGCFDTSFDVSKVYPHPTSDFLINDTGQCVNNNNFIFSNNTFISEGSFSNRWFFGDGSAFVNSLNASKKYKKDSTFIVTVISFSDQGCTDTATHTVTVFPKAKTNFTIDNPQQCQLDNVFNFTSTTTLKRGTFTLGWTYGDGNVDNNQTSVQHSYLSVQAYNVRLISQTNEGCMDTIIKPIRVLPMPVANYSFNYDKKCLLNNDFQFSVTSTVAGNTPMNHKWYYGDNDSLINTTFAQHSYAAYGTYKVMLISSTNIGNCRDTIIRDMTVFPMPVSSFVVDDNMQCLLNNSFTFTSTATVPTGTIDFTNWRLGDNTSSGVAAPVKSYSTVDSFRVSLTVITENGCLDSSFQKVYTYAMPVADFSVGPKIFACLDNNKFKITNKSKITNGVISLYQFYYGNGDSSRLQSPPDYTYPLSGDYIISLIVTTDKGCWDTASKAVSVNPNPLLDFDVDPVCLKDSSFFINNSTIPGGGSIISWTWKFGNGRGSTLESPAHKYRTVDSFTVSLSAITDKGCLDTITKKDIAIVHPNPKSKFTYMKLRSWENEVDIQYIDSSRDAVAWKWDFSSMGTSTDQNPLLYYTDTLTQPTTLIVTNQFGCNDTSRQLLFITPDVIYYMPNAFTPNEDNINESFKPQGLAFALNYKFVVFNRWGEIMFKTDNPQIGWDGKFENEPVPQELYFYRLEFVGADELRHEEKGQVMILR